VIESLQWLIDQGYVLLFLPFCHDPDKWSEQDVAFAHEIMAQLKYTDGVYCVQGYYTPREVAGMMGLTRLFIGMRYHAQVFAHALHLPLLPIAYEEKRTDFIKQYHYPVIPIAGLSGRTLISHLAAMLAEPPTRGAGRSGQAVGARNLVEIAG
jgi:polysaccharide pyruvyl transferase WcaK-like protein